MEKIKIGAQTFLYPMPTVLVGAHVAGKPNFLAIAYCGIVQHQPPMIEVTLGKLHYTNAGIKENGVFSVNTPSEEMVAITDYCGLVSGKKVDKSSLFDIFYGTLAAAPLIRECPLNLECRLVKTIDLGGANEIFLGEIVEAWAEERFLTDGLPDIGKMKPFVFTMHDNHYWRIGEHLGKAWNIGMNWKAKETKK